MNSGNSSVIDFSDSRNLVEVMELEIFNEGQKSNTKKPEIYHQPVMVQPVIQFLAPKNGLVVDCTVGGGGHAEAILSVLENGFLIGIDLDPDAIAYSQLRLNRFTNFRIFNNNFTELVQIVNEVLKEPTLLNLKLTGILFDLGISLHQIRTRERGFSYELNGPLDMRFGPSTSRKAADLIRYSSLPELEKIFHELGEERFYKRIAQGVVERRKEISNSRDLIELIETRLSKMPKPIKQKAVQRIFQALRIATNDELNNLKKGLQAALKLLVPAGRIVVLSYHSLEDRIVKNLFREQAKLGKLEILTKKPLRPTEGEIRQNRAAASARLRAAIKLG